MVLITVLDYKPVAEAILPTSSFLYYSSGAGDEFTLALNQKCFDSFRIRPRCLRDVSTRSSKCTIMDIDLEMPLGIAPTGFHKLASVDGENDTARAAGKAGIVYTHSSMAMTSIEEVNASAPNTLKWLQVYIFKERYITQSLVLRAEQCGYNAIVVTVDSPIYGFRKTSIQNELVMPKHLTFANFTQYLEEAEDGSDLKNNGIPKLDASLTWTDIVWLINLTKLPVIVKGILSADDAQLALQYGCKGIIISNHGGRQQDGVPATIEVLPEISDAVGGKLPIILDGGIYSGSDIFKAVALGANMVLIGRPVLWGLAVNGQKGVEDVIEILKEEFDRTMAMSGCSRISDIKREMVVHESHFISSLNR